MPSRPISPRLHGILDYATGAKLLLLPTLLRTGGSPSGRALRAAGLGHIAYAALTRYDVGLVKVLPFRAHLALDAAGAAGLVAAPWLLGTSDDRLRHWLPHVLAGLADAVVTALTDPAGADGAPGDVELSPPDPGAAVMPDGVEANAAMGARTIGVDGGRGARTTGGMGSGTGPGSDPGVGGQMA